jgi:hypothetical protein
MTREQREELETVAWEASVVDATVKLYLLAYVRTEDHEQARSMSGLPESEARSARGWLRRVGMLRPDGGVDRERLRTHREGDPGSLQLA